MKTDSFTLSPLSSVRGRIQWRHRVTGALLGLIVLAGGCLPVSINPFYTERDRVTDDRLAGRWKESGGDVWTFAKAEAAYHLTVESGSEAPGEFTATLFQLRGQRYLDLCPDRSSLEQAKLNSLYATLNIPGHTILRLGTIGNELEMFTFKLKAVKAELTKHPKLCRHQDYEGEGVLLTGPTAELQKFLVRTAPMPGLWETNKLVREAASDK